MATTLLTSSIKSLPFLTRGKVRDMYAVDDKHLLIVTSDRLSAFDVVLDDGRESRTFHLNRSYYGLYIPPMVWREINNFSSGAVCMALASDFYDEADYYREHDTFVTAVTSP